MDVDVKLIILFLFCRSKYKYLFWDIHGFWCELAWDKRSVCFRRYGSKERFC